MLAQILLTVGLAVVLLFLLSVPFLRRGPKLLFALVPLVAIVFVWFPGMTTEMAKAAGIGRGADLILYCWVVVTMLLGAVSHLRVHAVHRDLTQLARSVAINQAQFPQTPTAAVDETA